MAGTYEDDQVRSFIRTYWGKELFSTGAELVDYKGVLYNIKGSTNDPKAVRDHKGKSWAKLLISKWAGFSEAACYVTDPVPVPDESSDHDNFAVGGHMTPDPSGEVEEGGVAYLMPLCHWHNNPARNHTAFHHKKTKMLKLTGFMEKDSYVTFALRLADENTRTLLYFDDSTASWMYKKLDNEVGQTVPSQPYSVAVAGISSQDYAIFERQGDRFRIVETGIPTDDADST